MYRFFRDIAHAIVLTGSVRLQLFVHFRTMIYFIPGFGEFVEKSVFMDGLWRAKGISMLDCCIRNELINLGIPSNGDSDDEFVHFGRFILR